MAIKLTGMCGTNVQGYSVVGGNARNIVYCINQTLLKRRFTKVAIETPSGKRNLNMNINAHFFLFYIIPGVQFYIKNLFCLFAHYTFVRYFARWNLLKFVVLKHFRCEFLYGEPFCCLYRCFSIHIKMCILL